MLDQITNDMNSALKNGEKVKANTLRLLISNLKNKSIELGSELDDKQVLQVIQKTSKRHKESIKMFASYDKEDDGSFTFGDRTMIPASWVKKMTKIQ